MVDPPYWPGKTIWGRVRARSRSNLLFYRDGYPFHVWLIRNLWGIYYAVAETKRTLRIIRAARTFDLAKAINDQTVILVRNEHDDWLTPNLDMLQHDNPKLQIVHLPGDHDDFHYNPQAYVDLVQSLYKD